MSKEQYKVIRRSTTWEPETSIIQLEMMSEEVWRVASFKKSEGWTHKLFDNFKPATDYYMSQERHQRVRHNY